MKYQLNISLSDEIGLCWSRPSVSILRKAASGIVFLLHARLQVVYELMAKVIVLESYGSL